MRHTYAGSFRNTLNNAEPDGHGHSYGNSYTYRDSDSDSDGHLHGNSDSNPSCYPDSNPYTHTFTCSGGAGR